ncbi:MAG: hypothetical protein Q7W45_02785 [Bacteroidota bacterium]|nr:hypothetical protein [Bacteroidota bacterium]MDP3145820.1 hypothetical protein [Bacteroidota bacterium]MDP3558454.1 hypothetical protein [Bacteroidota bacterium]
MVTTHNKIEKVYSIISDISFDAIDDDDVNPKDILKNVEFEVEGCIVKITAINESCPTKQLIKNQIEAILTANKINRVTAEITFTKS